MAEPIPYATPISEFGFNPPDSRARNLAMMCHLLSLCILTGIPFAHVVGPLIGWLASRNSHWYVDHQGKEALNFNLTVMFLYLLCLPLMCLAGLGVVLAIAVLIFQIVMAIVAAVQVSNGINYRYPLTLRLIS